MTAGELTERITIQQTTRTPDGQGSFTETWVDVATVWAKAWTVSSTESTQGMQTTMIRVQKFAIRYRSVLKPYWRLKWGTRYFSITGVDPVGREWICLTCKEAAS